MYVLAVIVGMVVSVVVWSLAAHWIAVSITWVEDRYPEMVGSKRLRFGEAVACGALVVACFALAFWIARLLWVQGR